MDKKAFCVILASLTLLILLFSVFIPGTASAQIGANGGTTTLNSDIEMMSGIPVHGGGHFTWTVSGAAAGELRQAIILKYDIPRGQESRNWQLELDEVEQYALDLERYLEQGEHEYQGANLRKFALLNYNVRDDTKGLIGTSNATSENIEIRFYFDAWMPSGNEDISMSDTHIPDAIFVPVNETFVGTYEIIHTNYMVSVGDFTNVKVSKGDFFLIRTPFGEIYHYSVKFKAGDNPNEKLLYEPFNWIECPLVLFLMVVVIGYFVVTMPGRFRRYDVMKNIKLHTFAKVLLIIMLLLYFFAAFGGIYFAGMYLWIISIVFLFISLVASKSIYENAERITQMPKKPETDAQATGKEYDAEGSETEEEKLERDVQCVTCGEIFTMGERYSVSSAPCPACGSIGAVEFTHADEEIPLQ
ncbi:MAG: hypothetical protein JSV56_01445 [Methanomassiliicoccales archaeon]|nr:MAG: hypothetical protein JSV56_01445 [Methanomassiliicoccales archaeon]